MSALMNEQDPPIPQSDPLHFAPRRVRERSEPPTSATTALDPSIEQAVYQSIQRSLEPEIVRQPPAFSEEFDQRKALFGAVAIGVAALAALGFVLMFHAREPDAGASFAAAVQSIKPEPASPDRGASAALSEFRGVLTAADANQNETREPPDRLLQQFVQWRQKANADTSQ
jgi:hypothetical protein